MTDKIKLALERGKVSGAKVLLTNYYKEQDKAQWLQEKQAEFDLLFPVYRDMTDEEIAEYDSQFTEENPKPINYDMDGNEIPYEYPQVAIDYSEDETYVTFNDWINETRVVTEAVEEVSHIEVIDGMETKVIDVEAVVEVTELVRPYEPLDVTERVEAYLKPTVEADFRKLRDSYLVKCDIAINIALDNGEDATELRALRQALRDATIEWIMPDVSILG